MDLFLYMDHVGFGILCIAFTSMGYPHLVSDGDGYIATWHFPIGLLEICTRITSLVGFKG